jgi:predicted ArsR family transcriptional regulator
MMVSMGAAARPDRFGWERREATPAEYRAMANPLRLRIIRLCLYEARTNKELADALGMEPASTLHHVRLLVETGFLEPTETRPGPRGSTEKPYRSTGKSWSLEAPRDASEEEWLAVHDAVRDELQQVGFGRQITGARLGLKLSRERVEELRQHIERWVNELADTDPDEDGDHVGLYVVLHELD